jgi:hypothetical protein
MDLFLRKGLSRVSSKIVNLVAPIGSDPRRALIWHDAIRLGALAVMTAILFGITLACFHSFEDFQSQLASEWSRTGVAALNKHPAVAVHALRTSLSYEHDAARIHDDQVLLAEALADDGQLEEAKDYFLALWESTPGDGLINLQLARIAHLQRDDLHAADYYRDSIDGSWTMDAIARRNDARLELADLLIAQHKDGEARDVLLIAAANAPDDANLNLKVVEKLQLAGFAADALNLQERAAATLEARPNGK